MSARGRDLFDRYVRNNLNHPDLRVLDATSHAFNLTSMAATQHLPIAQVIEEVGPIAPALRALMKRR
jgi:hypothetical protein